MQHTKTQLIALLKRYNDAYYNTGESLVSDDVYDTLKEQLRDMDPNHELLSDVGHSPKGKGSKVTLPVYMGSLDKIKSSEKELDKFLDKWPGVEEFYVSDKLDGISALLVFKNNITSLYTRGNGVIGQNISHLLKYIRGIPSSLPDCIVVRGELIISLDDFASMPKKKTTSNPRNTASGIVNSKNNLESASYLNFVAYNLINYDSTKKSYYTLQNDKDYMSKTYGFKTVDYKVLTRNELRFESLSSLLEHRRSASRFEMDGLVIGNNDDNIIASNKNPDWAFAFKYYVTQDKAEVVVKNVEWKTSKDGLLKPVVVFDPVHISGVNISRATGFNGEYIKKNNIGIGSRIIVIRSGDVIPYIQTILSGTEPMMPTTPFVWEGKDIKVAGDIKNNDQILQELVSFFTVIDIKGLGPGIIGKIFEAGYHTPASVFKMSSEQFLDIPGMANKIALFDAIKSSILEETCVNLMHASNVFGKGFGSKKLKSIVEGLMTDDMMHIPSMESLLGIKGVSEITAVNYIKGVKAFKVFMSHMGLGESVCKVKAVTMTKTKSQSPLASNKWKDQIIVFTGVRNKELEEVIERGGGKITTSISKNTSLVITNDMDSKQSKLAKARQLGIKIALIQNFI